MEANLLLNGVRAIFALLDNFVYGFIAILYDILMNITQVSLFDNETITKFASRIYVFVGIIMLFKVTFSLINFLVNPDSITDKTNGAGNVAKNILITLVLIIIVPYAFNLLYTVQSAIIEDRLIEKLILGTTSRDGNSVSIRISDQAYTHSIVEVEGSTNEEGNPNLVCTSSNLISYSENSAEESLNTNGRYIALMTFRTFFRLSDNTLDKARLTAEEQTIIKTYCRSTSVAQIVDNGNYNAVEGDNTANGKGKYIFSYSFFFSTAVGIVIALLLLSFCFDIAVRVIKLGFLELFAPIPIISYIDPKSGKNGMFKKWLKEVGTTWASLFIRLITLFFAIYIIQIVEENIETMYTGNNKFWVMLFLIIGALMFAKQAPKLLEDILGIKMGGLQLNPFKKISDEALFGKEVLGLGAAAGAIGLGATTNAIHRGSQLFNADTYRDANGNVTVGSVLTGFGRTTLRTAGSTIAGGASSGYNAFQRTRKDGHVFGGMWNGYQVAMYSKLLREENRRKGGTLGGAISADLHRWTGTLTEGQREQIEGERMDQEIERYEAELRRRKEILRQRNENLRQQNDDLRNRKEALATQKQNLAAEKRQLAQEKHDELEPFQQYANYASKIKGRIENDKAIKDMEKVYHDMQSAASTEDDFKALTSYRAQIDAEKKEVARRLFAHDEEVQTYADRLDELRRNNADLNTDKYKYKADDGSFVSTAYFNAEHHKNVIEDSYVDRERDFTVTERNFESIQAGIDATQEQIDLYKRTQIDNYQRTEIDEYQRTQIDSIKNSDAYKTAKKKDSAAKTDNSTQFNTKTQEAGHMFSAGRPAQSNLSQQSYFNGGIGSGNGGSGNN